MRQPWRGALVAAGRAGPGSSAAQRPSPSPGWGSATFLARAQRRPDVRGCLVIGFRSRFDDVSGYVPCRERRRPDSLMHPEGAVCGRLRSVLWMQAGPDAANSTRPRQPPRDANVRTSEPNNTRQLGRRDAGTPRGCPPAQEAAVCGVGVGRQPTSSSNSSTSTSTPSSRMPPSGSSVSPSERTGSCHGWITSRTTTPIR